MSDGGSPAVPRLHFDGLSLEVSDHFREMPDLVQPPVVAVAAVDPWEYSDTFRPNLTVQVDPLTPQRATMPQLSAATMAAQIALGRHVVGCDLWAGPDEDEPGPSAGRRITSVYAAGSDTVVQLQHVCIRGDRAVTICVQAAAGNLTGARQSLMLAANTLEGDPAGVPPAPDPESLVPLDVFARDVLSVPAEIEDLTGIGAAEPWRAEGTALDEAGVEALRRGKLRRRADPTALRGGGYVDADRRLTDLGRIAHETLTSPTRRLSVEARRIGASETPGFAAFLDSDCAVVIADPVTGEAGPSTLDVIPTWTVADRLVRWLGLAPAWTVGIDDDGVGARPVDPRRLSERLADPACPAPADANPALRRMWELPWTEVTLTSTRRGRPVERILHAGEAGWFALRPDAEASLTPLPSSRCLTSLLVFCGFDL